MAETRPTLLRTMGLFSLVVYGVGDMVGAGIYGTVGDAAVQMGNAVWLSFVVSMVAAVHRPLLCMSCLALPASRRRRLHHPPRVPGWLPLLSDRSDGHRLGAHLDGHV